MPVNVKEIKENALMDIKVNKNFYLMVKDSLYTVFKIISSNPEGPDKLESIITKPFQDLTDLERAFYTLTLLVSEIEKNMKEQNLFTEKVIPEPGDTDFVEPKTD
tara:strand:+ start:245 stop:559 length:315 start_codon:yes stop_codon:yes gene_type:complete